MNILTHRLRVISDHEMIAENGKTYRIAIGKKGFTSEKQEGDNCTPVGIYLLRECWYRADKLNAPETALPVRTIDRNDGWCDDPKRVEYNKPIKRPFEGSYEKMWRDDDLYDLVIPLGYNDDPPIAGKGSAIFMHVAKPGYEGTEGCVALKKEDLLEILKTFNPGDRIDIRDGRA